MSHSANALLWRNLFGSTGMNFRLSQSMSLARFSGFDGVPSRDLEPVLGGVLPREAALDDDGDAPSESHSIFILDGDPSRILVSFSGGDVSRTLESSIADSASL